MHKNNHGFGAKQAALVALVTAAIGVIILVRIFAADLPIAFEAETGTVTSPAAKITKTGASGGSVIQFGNVGPSWNPKVACTAQITTVSAILGTAKSSKGGATFAGGGFAPGVAKDANPQACKTSSGGPAFVELHKVKITNCGIASDGDTGCRLTDPSLSTPNFTGMHSEMDTVMKKAGYAPPVPPGDKLIDVQGFVYWDPYHTSEAFHNYSGWEIHSFTAWRLAQ